MLNSPRIGADLLNRRAQARLSKHGKDRTLSVSQPSTTSLAARELAASPRFAVRRLALTDYRCYAHLRLEVDARSVVLTGPNGAGKTNLLEALSYLAPGRGLRGARLAEADRIGGGPWAVAAILMTPDGERQIGTGPDPDARGAQTIDDDGRRAEKRIVRYDGQPGKGPSSLSEAISVLWLTPAMDRLFVEGASARRRFLDRLVFGLDPAHAGRISAYERAMRERARLLRHGGADAAWLSALEQTMAEQIGRAHV